MPSVLQYCTTEGSGVAGDHESLSKVVKENAVGDSCTFFFFLIFLTFTLTDTILFLVGLLEQTTGGKHFQGVSSSLGDNFSNYRP